MMVFTSATVAPKNSLISMHYDQIVQCNVSQPKSAYNALPAIRKCYSVSKAANDRFFYWLGVDAKFWQL